MEQSQYPWLRAALQVFLGILAIQNYSEASAKAQRFFHQKAFVMGMR